MLCQRYPGLISLDYYPLLAGDMVNTYSLPIMLSDWVEEEVEESAHSLEIRRGRDSSAGNKPFAVSEDLGPCGLTGAGPRRPRYRFRSGCCPAEGGTLRITLPRDCPCLKKLPLPAADGSGYTIQRFGEGETYGGAES